MERKPEVSELLEWLEKLVNWKKFGSFLPKMEPHFIEIIKKDEDDISSRKIALFGKWLRVCPEANWGHVIDALEKANEDDLAKNVKKNLGVTSVDASTGMKKL